MITFNSFDDTNFSIIIPKIDLSETIRGYRCGYAPSSSNIVGIRVDVNISKAVLNVASAGGASFLSNTKLTVYYR